VENYCRAGQVTEGTIIQRMYFTCWISKVTDTHSEHVIVIAVSEQHWLRERATILSLHYIACLVNSSYVSDEQPVDRRLCVEYIQNGPFQSP